MGAQSRWIHEVVPHRPTVCQRSIVIDEMSQPTFEASSDVRDRNIVTTLLHSFPNASDGDVCSWEPKIVKIDAEPASFCQPHRTQMRQTTQCAFHRKRFFSRDQRPEFLEQQPAG